MAVSVVVFIPGVELAGRLYDEAVRPLLSRHFPGLTHTAALIGRGSEVLGFDTTRSTDHDWGPRLQLFLAESDHADRISDLLAEELPTEIAGYSTHMPVVHANGVRGPRPATGRLEHAVTVAELGSWLTGHLGFDPRGEITPDEWLATPTQVLAEVTGGAVFHDDLGLDSIRRRLSWYPDDVWRYVLACHWCRVEQEEAFVGRCGEVGDELGSAVVAARLVRQLMRLALLAARVYPPYSKWLGSAFARLPYATRLTPVLRDALAATDWHDRERHLVQALEAVATLSNDTGLTEPVDPHTRYFYERPYRVLHAERFVTALTDAITDPALRTRTVVGIDPLQ